MTVMKKMTMMTIKKINAIITMKRTNAIIKTRTTATVRVKMMNMKKINKITLMDTRMETTGPIKMWKMIHEQNENDEEDSDDAKTNVRSYERNKIDDNHGEEKNEEQFSGENIIAGEKRNYESQSKHTGTVDIATFKPVSKAAVDKVLSGAGDVYVTYETAKEVVIGQKMTTTHFHICPEAAISIKNKLGATNNVENAPVLFLKVNPQPQ